MSTRILHSGASIENVNLCLQHNIAGFSRRGPHDMLQNSNRSEQESSIYYEPSHRNESH